MSSHFFNSRKLGWFFVGLGLFWFGLAGICYAISYALSPQPTPQITFIPTPTPSPTGRLNRVRPMPTAAPLSISTPTPVAASTQWKIEVTKNIKSNYPYAAVMYSGKALRICKGDYVEMQVSGNPEPFHTFFCSWGGKEMGARAGGFRIPSADREGVLFVRVEGKPGFEDSPFAIQVNLSGNRPCQQ